MPVLSPIYDKLYNDDLSREDKKLLYKNIKEICRKENVIRPHCPETIITNFTNKLTEENELVVYFVSFHRVI